MNKKIVRVNALDDWYPNFPDGTVEVTFWPDSTRVYIAGNDDFEMELEYSGWDILMFNAFCKTSMSQDRCKKLGFNDN